MLETDSGKRNLLPCIQDASPTLIAFTSAGAFFIII